MSAINDILDKAKAFGVFRILGGVFILVMLLVGINSFFDYKAIKTDGPVAEERLNSQYEQNKALLGKLSNEFYESLGVADRNNAALTAIIQEAAKGNSGAFGTSTAKGSPFYIALQQAWPEATTASSAKLYENVQLTIAKNRSDYNDAQKILSDQIRNYRTWYRSGMIHPSLVSRAGFPSSDLVVHASDKDYHGKDALDQMARLVTSDYANKAYDTHTDGPLIGGPTPSK